MCKYRTSSSTAASGHCAASSRNISYEAPSVLITDIGIQECMCSSPVESPVADDPYDFEYGGKL